MSNFISFLDTQIRSFIMYRKASDHWNESSYEQNLIMFGRYCNRNYPTTTELSQVIVDSWCKQHPNETNNSCRSRIYVVVSFIRYLNNRGLTTVLEPNIPKKERRLYVPHAFTDTELKNFFMHVIHCLINHVPKSNFLGKFLFLYSLDSFIAVV